MRVTRTSSHSNAICIRRLKAETPEASQRINSKRLKYRSAETEIFIEQPEFSSRHWTWKTHILMEIGSTCRLPDWTRHWTLLIAAVIVISSLHNCEWWIIVDFVIYTALLLFELLLTVFTSYILVTLKLFRKC